MKKYFLLIALIALFVSQLTFAQTSTPTTTPRHKPTTTPRKFHKPSTTTPTTTPSGIYKACVGKKVRELAKEMQTKKKETLNEFMTAYKNATSTEVKREIRKNYNQKIRDLNEWFNQEVRRAKNDCRGLMIPTLTPTTSTST